MQNKSIISVLFAPLAVLTLAACAPPQNHDKPVDRSIHWVRTAAEYDALALQAYAAASEDLNRFIADTAWSALPNQADASELPLAIITDVDETVVSNVEFQATFELPFKNSKLDDWNDQNEAKPIPGVVEFLHLVKAAGIAVFFVTNRPCEAKAGFDDPCPQKAVTLQDLREIGIDVDAEHLMLADERPEWNREKVTRRAHIAKTHRVIMLLGDDLSDFISCSRKKRLHPCAEGATVSSRRTATIEFGNYWGEGWYILPNPMHGSWTTVK